MDFGSYCCGAGDRRDLPALVYEWTKRWGVIGQKNSQIRVVMEMSCKHYNPILVWVLDLMTLMFEFVLA